MRQHGIHGLGIGRNKSHLKLCTFVFHSIQRWREMEAEEESPEKCKRNKGERETGRLEREREREREHTHYSNAHSSCHLRLRFHLPVGTEVTVRCPAMCSKFYEAPIYGPGDGTKSTDRCSGYGTDKLNLFSDASSICRTAIAMRAIGVASPGLVTFRIEEPIRSYPRCDAMPHASPGLPYGSVFKELRRFRHLSKVGSHSHLVHNWEKASRQSKIDVSSMRNIERER